MSKEDDGKVDEVMREIISFSTNVSQLSRRGVIHAHFPGQKRDGAIYFDRNRLFTVTRARAIAAARNELEMARLKHELAVWIRAVADK